MEKGMGAEKLRKELDFAEKKEELVRFLAAKDNAVMVLATSHDDRVLARNVLIASDGLDLYLPVHLEAFSQIRANPGEPQRGTVQRQRAD
jgi:hypothetical protein